MLASLPGPLIVVSGPVLARADVDAAGPNTRLAAAMSLSPCRMSDPEYQSRKNLKEGHKGEIMRRARRQQKTVR